MSSVNRPSNERLTFEAWVKDAYPDRWPNPDADGTRASPEGNYRNTILQLMWLSWQEARRQPDETYGEHAARLGEGPCMRCVGKRVIGPSEETTDG